MGLLTALDSFVRSCNAVELLSVAIALAAAPVIISLVYNVYFHPLAKFPGPRLAGLSRLWYCWYCLRGDLVYVLDDAHKKYGDVVRIAPNELSYTDPEVWNEIYGHRSGKNEVMKDPVFYSSMSSGQGSIINADRARHGHLRKQISHGFSEKALRFQEPVIRGYADMMMQRLEENVKAGTPTVDLVSWFNFFTFDVMGDLVFGESFGCLKSSSYHPWVKLIFESVKIGAFVRCSKYWPFLTPLAQRLIPSQLRKQRIEQRQMAKDRAASRKAIDDGRQDLISGFLKPDSEISHLEYQSTVETLIIAGSETTATLMSGALFYLLKDPIRMKKVATEIRTSFSSPAEIDFVSVNKLTYLLACLNETLRVYPPVPDGFPRNTGPRAEMIGRKSVPSDTIIRVTQWPTYRSPRNFTRPDEFIPERWLEGHPEFDNDKKEALQPFLVGPRNCVGRNLAYVEMRLLTALLIWHFDLELDSRSNNWSQQKVFLLWEKPPMYVKVIARPV